MDQRPTRNYLYGRNEKTDKMTEKSVAVIGDYVEKKCTMCKRNKFIPF